MATLWIFGDSFSMDYNEDCSTNMVEYVKWKGRKIKTYGNFVSETLNYELKNLAVGGSDNYTIFNVLCDNIEHIKENDIVIIGWGPKYRFRIANTNGNWLILNGNFTGNEGDFIENIKNRTINEILVNRFENDIYKSEIKSWINLIKVALKNNIVYDWYWGDDFLEITDKFQLISQETNGLIHDTHWTEDGHEKFSKIILEIIKK